LSVLFGVMALIRLANVTVAVAIAISSALFSCIYVIISLTLKFVVRYLHDMLDHSHI